MTTKIHMVCDALGYPLKFVVTGGHIHDVTQAERLLEDQKAEAVIADRGYDSDPLRVHMLGNGMNSVIPGRSNRLEPIRYDIDLYKERNFIERTFNKLKHCRRIAIRYEKTLVNFMALLHLAAAMFWLR